MIFKKWKRNKKIKPRDRKRKIVKTIALSLSLLFGKAQLNYSRSSNSKFDNQIVHERFRDNQEFDLFEEKNPQVILVRTVDSRPSAPISREGYIICRVYLQLRLEVGQVDLR